MCIMSCVQQLSNTPRLELLKRLLCGASPRNPTYILSRVLANFKAKSGTELTVKCGEEVFILFEISDWAFVTVFSDTNRRGYVPLDYCEVVKDFYEFPSVKPPPNSTSTSQQLTNSVACKHNSTDGKVGVEYGATTITKESLVHLRRTITRKSTCSNTNSNTKHSQKPEIVHPSTDSARVATLCTTDNTSIENCEQAVATHYHTSKHSVGSQSQCTTLEAVSQSDVSNCRHCCNRLHSRCDRDHEFSHVLRYLSQSDLMESPPDQLEDSESGLGDSESVQSAGDLMKTCKLVADLNDISTQTSVSLEDLRPEASVDLASRLLASQTSTQLADASEEASEISPEFLIPPPLLYQTPGPAVFSPDEDDHDSRANHSLHTSVSCDSAYSDSVFDRSLTNQLPEQLLRNLDSAGISPLSKSQEDNSNHYENIRRWQQPASSSDEHDEHKVPVTPVEKLNQQELRRKLSLPILKPTTAANRVQLTRLSERIKEQLMPARAELKKCRLEKDVVSSMEIPSVGDGTSTALSASSSADSSPTKRNIEERRQRRGVAFQIIQEQYKKLEEARLLHNALKHISQTMTSTSEF